MSKIIVVDDDSGIRKMCYDLFKADGHEVLTVPRGTDIFGMLRAEKPDLILMDIGIPGEEGLSLLRRMPNQKENRVPVVIFSGMITPEIEKEAIERGALDVIQKGIGMIELRNRIGKILETKHRILLEPDKVKDEKTILFVDDEEGILKLLEECFRPKGFKTFKAKSGAEALDLVEKKHPSVILLDVSMPGMDGLFTLKRIREIDPDVGVVMATGLQDQQLAEEAVRLGAYAFVSKPFNMQYLDHVVQTRLMLAA